jgi:hypothetical protein
VARNQPCGLAGCPAVQPILRRRLLLGTALRPRQPVPKPDAGSSPTPESAAAALSDLFGKLRTFMIAGSAVLKLWDQLRLLEEASVEMKLLRSTRPWTRPRPSSSYGRRYPRATFPSRQPESRCRSAAVDGVSEGSGMKARSEPQWRWQPRCWAARRAVVAPSRCDVSTHLGTRAWLPN